jgi:aminoglycoside 3-N-acetyltransferase
VNSSEHELIAAAKWPVTSTQLVKQLRELTIETGDTILVHSSLSKLGWVIGGAQAVVESLLTVAGPEGTIIMPTHSTHWTEPAGWSNPPVPTEWFAEIYAHIPSFDVNLTPPVAMGAIVDCFRHVPGVKRSNHPWASFAAYGKHAAFVTENHRLEEGMGEHSPVARAYDLDAKVALLGVGHEHNSSLHLCEHRADWSGKTTERQGAAITVDGMRQWVTYDQLVADSDDFEQLGADFDATGQTIDGPAGYGTAKVMSQRNAIDFGTAWMNLNR